MSAAARAAHLIVDSEPYIVADTLASALLGDRAGELIAYHRHNGAHPVLSSARTQVTLRSRYTEDRLARSGLTQYVILGAGLDTYAYRQAASGVVRVFEVDHPATQQWKRATLAGGGIQVPATVSFVPSDFETAPAEGALAPLLVQAGFDITQPALVSCLGVIMYLTREALGETLAQVATLASGTELIADYMLPAGLRDQEGDDYVAQVAPAAAERGEPWRTFPAPAELTGLLAAHGFTRVTHLTQREALPAGLWNRSDPLRPTGLSQLAHATLAR